MEPRLVEKPAKALGREPVPREAALRCLGASFVEGAPGYAAAPGWKIGALAGRLDALWLKGIGIGAAGGIGWGIILADWAEGVDVLRSAMTRWREERASLLSEAETAPGAGEEEDCLLLFCLEESLLLCPPWRGCAEEDLRWRVFPLACGFPVRCSGFLLSFNFFDSASATVGGLDWLRCRLLAPEEGRGGALLLLVLMELERYMFRLGFLLAPWPEPLRAGFLSSLFGALGCVWGVTSSVISFVMKSLVLHEDEYVRYEMFSGFYFSGEKLCVETTAVIRQLCWQQHWDFLTRKLEGNGDKVDGFAL